MPGMVLVELSRTPPSLNRSRGGNQGRASVMKQHRLKRELQDEIGWMLRASELPRGCLRVEASARLRFPVKRVRDEGNHSSGLDKALADALQEGGYIENDDPAHYRFTGLEFEDERGSPRTVIVLRWR